MKEKIYIKQKTLIGVLIAVIMAVIVVFGIGTSMSAKAEVSDPSGWSCSVDYDLDGNRIGVYYSYAGSVNLSAPIHMKVTFVCGSKSWVYTDDNLTLSVRNFSGTKYISIAGNDFFVGGLSYTVSVLLQDAEAYETYLGSAPYEVNFNNCYTFTIPGDIVPLPTPPTKEGYHFVGWYYDEALTQPYDNAPIYEDTNLYAKMEINTYTVSFDTQCDIVVPSATVEWNSSVKIPTPTRTGYNFVGWFYANGVEYNDEPITNNTTLFAHWDIKYYTVTFYLGSDVFTSLEVPYGSVLSDVMQQASVTGYRALNTAGVRVSLSSTIQDNTELLLYELTGWEKYGDFVSRNHWYSWLTLSVCVALAVTSGVSIAIAVKRR